MQVTYTNRKGRTYHLCQGVTRTGKPRYYFAREPKGKPVEQIPEGYEIPPVPDPPDMVEELARLNAKLDQLLARAPAPP